jgi:hypothetical protein
MLEDPLDRRSFLRLVFASASFQSDLHKTCLTVNHASNSNALSVDLCAPIEVLTFNEYYSSTEYRKIDILEGL